MATLEDKIKQMSAQKYAPMESQIPEQSRELAPIDVEAEAIPEKEDKVSPLKLEEIKRIFSTNPETRAELNASEIQQPPVQNMEQQASTSQQPYNPAMPTASNTDLLLGLVPLATAALFGGKGEGVTESAKYYNQLAADEKKQKGTLEQRLFELEKSRASAKAKAESGKLGRRFQSVNIVNPETQEVVKANYDTFTGAYSLPDGTSLNADKIRAGYAVIPEEFNRRTDVKEASNVRQGEYFGRGTITDPTTGLKAQVRDGKIVPIQKSEAALNPKQEKDLNNIVDKFKSTDMYKKTVSTLTASENVDSLLEATNSGNPTAANLARTQLARMAGEVGTMTEGDIERTGGSPAIKEQAKRFSNLQRTNVPLLPADIVAMKEVARIFKQNATNKLQKSIAGLESDAAQYGIPEGAVATKMRAYIPTMDRAVNKFPLQVRKNGKVATVSNEKELKEASAEGWK